MVVLHMKSFGRFPWNFVDVFNFGGIFDDNLNMTTIDGLHPNNLGYKISVKPWLEQLEILYEIL